MINTNISIIKVKNIHFNKIILLRSHLLTASKYEKMLLKNLISKIENETPFDAMGFFNIELSTFTSTISMFLTYLIILVQFKDSTTPECKQGSGSNLTADAYGGY